MLDKEEAYKLSKNSPLILDNIHDIEADIKRFALSGANGIQIYIKRNCLGRIFQELIDNGYHVEINGYDYEQDGVLCGHIEISWGE